VLNTLNTRLDAETIAFMLKHAEAKILITDTEFAGMVEGALAQTEAKPLVIDIADPQGPGGKRLGRVEYEAFIADGDPEFKWRHPADEWDAISLNYTSGTTGNPKGVVYHHRGAALMGYANVLACRMAERLIYLWTLPMFPLQRLVLPLDGRSDCRHARLPALGPGEGDLCGDRRAQGDASLWRAHRDGCAVECQTGRAAPVQP